MVEEMSFNLSYSWQAASYFTFVQSKFIKQICFASHLCRHRRNCLLLLRLHLRATLH